MNSVTSPPNHSSASQSNGEGACREKMKGMWQESTILCTHKLFSVDLVEPLCQETHIQWHVIVWTFSAGADEQSFTCPCVTGSTAQNRIPSFVGQNYFCESGLTRWNGTTGVFWPDGDPLWDGQGCGPTSSCCTFNSPPWFNVQLSSPTTDNIEVRICATNGFQIEDTPTEHIELDVKWTGHDPHQLAV